MRKSKIKESLLQIASRVTSDTTIEEVYEQLALLSDIAISEQQEKEGMVASHADVKRRSKKWLK
jgi:hypothetical protein